MNKEQKRLGNKGFSLVELIVVIAIMAILVAVLAPTLLSKIEESREGTDYSALGELKTAVEEAVLGSESTYNAVKTEIEATASKTSITYEVAFNKASNCAITSIDGKTGTGTTAGDKLYSAVTKVISALEFKSDTAKNGKVFITITKDGKVSAKIASGKDKDPETKKNEDPFEVK